MAWTTEIVKIVRNIINDVDDSDYTYSNSRLQEVIVVAAQFLIPQIDFVNTYTITVDGTIDADSIDPDPTVTSTLDNNFTNLIALQASVIIYVESKKRLGDNLT